MTLSILQGSSISDTNNMAFSDLQTRLSGTSRILTDSGSEEFQIYMERWSELNRQTPAAIALPETEEDVAAIVCHHGVSNF